jgi:hypothetical protein
MYKTLTYDTKFIINGLRCHVMTLTGFAAKQGFTVEQFYTIYPGQRKNDPRPAGLYTGSALVGDKGAYERENAKWLDAITLEHSEIVLIDGVKHKTIYKGIYSDAVLFSPITDR